MNLQEKKKLEQIYNNKELTEEVRLQARYVIICQHLKEAVNDNDRRRIIKGVKELKEFPVDKCPVVSDDYYDLLDTFKKYTGL